MNIELIVLIIITLSGLLLYFLNSRVFLYVLLTASVLLHKELFSFYRWDFLPIRFIMIAFCIGIFFTLVKFLLKNRFNISLYKHLLEPFTILLGFLWLLRAVSLINSKNMSASLLLLAFFTTITVVGFYLFFYLRKDPNQILKFVNLYIFIAFILSLIGYIQLFAYYKFGYVFGSLWTIPGNIPRVGSLFWDVNHFGALLASVLPILGVYILTAKTVKSKILSILAFLPITGMLFLTNSRTAWIIGFVAFVIFCLIVFYNKFKTKGLAIVVACGFLITIPFFVEYSDRNSPFRAKIKEYFNYRIDSFDSHFLLLTGTFQVFEKFPVLGGGYGSFFEHFSDTDISSEYFSRDPAGLNTRVPAHTIWGELLAETGILGFSAFILFIGYNLLVLLYKSLHSSNNEQTLISAAMFSALVGWLVAGVFYSYNSEYFWLVVFLYSLYGLSIGGEDTNIKNLLSFYSKSQKVFLIPLLLISACLIFINLGTNHLIPWDEAIYAKIAKNMVVNDDYINMTWQIGKIWYEKPPMYMQLMAIFMTNFGFNALSARLPSALFGFGTVILVYLWGKHMFSRTAGYISAIALVTTFQFLYYSRTSMVDVTATFFITLALFGFYLLYKSDMNKNLLWSLIGLSIGYSAMTKGVVGLIPLGIVGLLELSFLINRRFRTLKRDSFSYLLFIGCLALLILPWHLRMYMSYGMSFIENYLGYHVLERATREIEDKGKPFFWYLEVLKVSMRLWFIALIPSLLWSLKKVFKDKSFNNFFLLFCVLCVFLVFSSATSKLVWYIMPLYPLLCLIIGQFLHEAFIFVSKKLPVFDNHIGKFAYLFVITMVALCYLLINKNLVYTSDLTGPQASLLIKKDFEFGIRTKVFADNIELPLVLFYSNGPYQIVDFTPLRNELAGAEVGSQKIFITKESRLRKLKTEFPEVDQISREGDWVLGVYEVKEPIIN